MWAPVVGIADERRIGRGVTLSPQGTPVGQRLEQGHDALGARFGVDLVVHNDGGRAVALSQARRGAYVYVRQGRGIYRGAGDGLQICGAAQQAGHVVAYSDVDLRGRLQAKMGIKTGQSVQAIKGHVDAAGKGL